MRSRDGGDEVEESNLKFGNAKSNIPLRALKMTEKRGIRE
jgi:hypothetical protein